MTRFRMLATTAAITALTSQLVAAAPAPAEIVTTWGCGEDLTVTVVDQRYALGNIVVEYDGDPETRVRISEPFEQRDADGREVELHEYAIPDSQGATTIWVKAGNNRSEDGPGYGERIDVAQDECTEFALDATIEWTSDDGTVEALDDFRVEIRSSNGDRSSTEILGACVAATVPETSVSTSLTVPAGEHTIVAQSIRDCVDNVADTPTFTIRLNGTVIYTGPASGSPGDGAFTLQVLIRPDGSHAVS